MQLCLWLKKIGWNIKGLDDVGHYKPLPADQHEQWTANYKLGNKTYSARNMKIMALNECILHYNIKLK
jgi:hypothetical protein